MPKFESRPENIERIKRITDVLLAHKDGDTITWLDLETATGIPMRASAMNGVRGRDLTRRALRQMGREVETITDVGFRLSSAENTIPILHDKLDRAAKALRRADDARGNLWERHGAQLTAGARDRMTQAGALLATLTMQAKGGRKLLK